MFQLGVQCPLDLFYIQEVILLPIKAAYRVNHPTDLNNYGLFQVQAEHGLLRIQGEAASSWTEERQRGGAEAVDKEEERSAAWPTSLDMTLPLERSSKPEGLPDNVLFQSIRNSYEVIMLE